MVWAWSIHWPARSIVIAAHSLLVAGVLTAAEMEGRRSGTVGGDRAARQIADWLAATGLRPGGDQGSFLQTFVLETSSRLGSANTLEISTPAPWRLEVGRDWIPHGGSPAGEVSGDVVFVGYGADL